MTECVYTDSFPEGYLYAEWLTGPAKPVYVESGDD
jgi:hypothetical protein